MRIKAAFTATAIAEGFRDMGKSVLLMMDSVTRFALASEKSVWLLVSLRVQKVIRQAYLRSFPD
jgi:flagellar biosynthesis/type III secretory pathway ATPase